MKKILLVLLSLTLVLSLAACSGEGNNDETNVSEFPNKNIEIIVAYKAGGGTDVGARVLASAAEDVFGQSIVILNKPGSDGELGYTELTKSNPDGYTLGFINLPTYVSLTLERDTEYEIGDVEPILNHVYDSGVLVVQGTSEWDTLEDFIDYAKANPGEITISNNGTGASNHIGAAHLEYEAGIDVTHVPFGGSTDMLAALRGGHVDATVAKISEVANLVEAGELRILASFTEERLGDFSDVPTLKEKGYDILFGSARALVAPKGTPQEIIDILHDGFKEALESEEHMENAKNAALPIQYMSPEELSEYIKNEEIYLNEIREIIDL
ncbi:tripartite tricarboxylate transporter substrate binding protein, partial [Schnuerera sp.]|uniref:tripartite tricarboxylate transporter substrate binding protein n=1 Tax=Schnuerera sp. TaxID=2794844 RepID=UPI002BD51064